MISIIKLLRNYLKLELFSRKWRQLNKHNETIAKSIFNISNVEVGIKSYGPLNIYQWGAENEFLRIGNFVSIANDVKFVLGGNHFYKTMSTFPFRVKLGLADKEAYSNGMIIVEDDVWIGMNCLILSGVTIGKGSVVAAGSVVTKNVEPYSIVGGNPAKEIKKRFDKSIIDRMKGIDLTHMDLEKVRQYSELLYTDLTEDVLNDIEKTLISRG